MRVALLGGTGEARELVARLDVRPDVSVELSLARDGGFGGVDGMVDYLRSGHFDALVDATHPFATVITSHAIAAAQVTGVPLLVLRRPGWRPQPGDDWHRVAGFAAAQQYLARVDPQTVFLAIGRTELARFADDRRHRYLLRMLEPPRRDDLLPARRDVVLARGPFDLSDELELLRRRSVGLIVTKDSGGSGAAAKLAAARQLALPVVMIERPSIPSFTFGTSVVETVPAALDWLFSSSR